MRAKYCIVRGRSVAKRFCQYVVCKKAEGRHYSVPDPPPLPKPLFTSVGVDFAGPLYIRKGIGTTESKFWLCPYKCCVTWAIHLDLLTNMTLEYFLRSFPWSVSRWGLPETVISDNAKTFNCFKEIVKVKHYLKGARIQWHFNLEKALWWHQSLKS